MGSQTPGCGGQGLRWPASWGLGCSKPKVIPFKGLGFGCSIASLKGKKWIFLDAVVQAWVPLSSPGNRHPSPPPERQTHAVRRFVLDCQGESSFVFQLCRDFLRPHRTRPDRLDPKRAPFWASTLRFRGEDPGSGLSGRRGSAAVSRSAGAPGGSGLSLGAVSSEAPAG